MKGHRQHQRRVTVSIGSGARLVSGVQAPLYYFAHVAPTVLRQGPYRFYFFAGDRAEPAHIHVEGADGEAKFWLRPVALADAWGYSARELRTIGQIVAAHRDEFLRAWDAFFST